MEEGNEVGQDAERREADGLIDRRSHACCVCVFLLVQCAAQPGFLLQPFMKGLCWESRTYFNRGEFQYSLMSDQPPSNRAAPNANNITSAFNTVEVRGHNRISVSSRDRQCAERARQLLN